MGLLAELRADPLDVDRVLLGLLKVILDSTLEILVGGMLDHFLLALYEAVLGVVDLAELEDKQVLLIAYRHIFEPFLRSPAKALSLEM